MSSSANYDQIRVARRRRKISKESPALQMQALYGKPPLLPGESEVAYLDLSGRIQADMAPGDAIQHLLVRDIIDLTWEIHRLQQAKASYLRAQYQDAAIELEKKYDWRAANDLRNETPRAAAINRALKRLKLAPTEVNAQTIMSKVDTLDKVERRLAQLTSRRNSLLLEFEQRREAVDRWARREKLLEREGSVTGRDIEGEATVLGAKTSLLGGPPS